MERKITDGRLSLSTDAATIASTDRASVSVMTVPLVAMPTARWLVSPCSWTIGYEMRVCEAHRDP